jgi:arsenite methyltransferase
MHDDTDIKEAVRERYAGAATRDAAATGPAMAAGSCCGGEAPVVGASASSCCGAAPTAAAPSAGTATASGCGCGSAPAVIGGSTESAQLGYDAGDLAAIPEGADLGLGCGNPLAVLELQPGETVLDLGSGGGIDCFLAARRVGSEGRVIGVDMTPEMVARARRNAGAQYPNVDFRLGEIEHLPVADATVDAIISNCVINLVPDKAQVFRDAFRVLRPGGRVSVSDIVLLGEVPVAIRDSVEAYVACLSGAILRDDYLRLMAEAGFTDVQVTEARAFDLEDVVSADLVAQYRDFTGATEAELRAAAAMFQSVRVSARKPA